MGGRPALLNYGGAKWDRTDSFFVYLEVQHLAVDRAESGSERLGREYILPLLRQHAETRP